MDEQDTTTSNTGIPQETGSASMDIFSLIHYSISLYIVSAWQMLGYVPDPLNKQISVNIEQAKIAIDCADFLAGQLRPHVEEEILREHQRQIRDLKVNYLDKISSEGS
jgi:hypothetical protein